MEVMGSSFFSFLSLVLGSKHKSHQKKTNSSISFSSLDRICPTSKTNDLAAGPQMLLVLFDS
jgi:hypothetical protein